MNDQLRRYGRCLVVISEGFDVGDLGELKDAFGHATFGSSRQTVAQIVVNYLNRCRPALQGRRPGNVPGTDQRTSMAYASSVDLDEAYRLGQKAVELAASCQSGFMATILREPGPDLHGSLRQGAIGRGGQQRANIPQAVDCSKRL